MIWATDRELLVFEPNLFRDVSFGAQRRIDISDGEITGTSLTSALADFTAAGIAIGAVALADGAPLEVLEVISANELTVSRLRADCEGAAVPPVAGSNLRIEITTFEPQVAIVHEQLLSALQSSLDDATDDDLEAAVINVRDMIRVEAIGSLSVIYSAAASIAAEASILRQKAELYRERYAAARCRFVARLDLDGDGVAETVRALNIMRLMRG